MAINNSLNINTVTPLDLGRGGSSASLTADNGGVIYSTASAMAVLGSTATAHQLLLSGASASPLWSTTTYPTTNAINTLLYASSANVMGALATLNNGVLTTSNTGVPAWLANSGTPGFVLTANTGAPPSWQAASAAASSTTYVNSSPYTVLTSDDIILVDTTLFAAPMSVVLRSSPAIDGQVWTVKDWSGSAGAFNITVTVAGATNTIDGAASFVLSKNYESVSFAYSVSRATYSIVDEANSPSATSITIAGDTGSIAGSSLTIFANNVSNDCGSSVLFANSVTTSTLKVSDVNNNTMIGQLAGNATISGNQNVALGYQSLHALTSGRLNIAIGGTNTLSAMLSGSSNIAIGGAALQQSTVDSNNIAIGTNALSSLLTGDNNVAIGFGALGSATSAAGNVAIGFSALPLCNEGNIVAIGFEALTVATSVSHSVAVGSSALAASTGDSANTAVGYNTLMVLDGGNSNTAVGALALSSLTAGSANIAIGPQALSGALTVNDSIAIGSNVLAASTADTFNVAMGINTLQRLNGGISNTALGTNTGNNILTGNYNLFLGFQSGNAYTGAESANIAINTHGSETVGESHTLRIGGGTGTGGVQSLAHVYICGITGSTPSSGNIPQVVLCDNQSNITAISSSTTGFVLTSNGTATPSFQALVPQTPWTIISTPFTASFYNGYFVSGTTTATLPSGTVAGQTIYFIAASNSVLTIQAAAGQAIRLGANQSALAGTAASSAKGDSMTLVYDTTGAVWYAISAIGNAWTIT